MVGYGNAAGMTYRDVLLVGDAACRC